MFLNGKRLTRRGRALFAAKMHLEGMHVHQIVTTLDMELNEENVNKVLSLLGNAAGMLGLYTGDNKNVPGHQIFSDLSPQNTKKLAYKVQMLIGSYGNLYTRDPMPKPRKNKKG